MDNNNRIYDGVEVNKDGAVVAYWFRNTYPYQITYEYYRSAAYVPPTS